MAVPSKSSQAKTLSDYIWWLTLSSTIVIAGILLLFNIHIVRSIADEQLQQLAVMVTTFVAICTIIALATIAVVADKFLSPTDPE